MRSIAYELLSGHKLYADIFFTNLPLFAYISEIYFLITKGDIYVFYFTSSLEAALVAMVIYKIVYRETSDYITSLSSSLLYLFSLVILFVTNGQQGIITASLFAVVAYYFLQKGKYLLAGTFLSLCFLTKGYFIIVILPFFLKTLLQKNRKNYHLYIAFVTLTALVILPFVLGSLKEALRDTVQFYLSKGVGMSKGTIFQHVLIYDPLLLILLFYNILRIHKNLFFGTLSLLFIFYFTFSAGFYYVYLGMITPFLCISYPNFYFSLKKLFQPQKYIQITVVSMYVFYPLLMYLLSFSSLNKINHFPEMVATIKKEKPSYIYGVSSLSPILAYETGTPLLENIVDTNEDLYKNKIYDGTKLTREAIQKRTMLISVGSFYPDQNIREDIVNISIDKSLAKKHCRYVIGFRENIGAGVNMVNFYRCY